MPYSSAKGKHLVQRINEHQFKWGNYCREDRLSRHSARDHPRFAKPNAGLAIEPAKAWEDASEKAEMRRACGTLIEGSADIANELLRQVLKRSPGLGGKVFRENIKEKRKRRV